jgi:hypothetical protein
LSFSENKGCFTFGGSPPKVELCIHSCHFPYIILAIYPVSLFAKNPVFLFSDYSRPREQTKKYRKSREMGYVKMIVIDELDNDSVNYEVSKNVNPDSHIISDKWRGFSKVSEVVEKHTPEVVKPEDCMKKLPWVHTIISNCKREFLGTHHSVSRTYLQSYLNEFCYKLNRRGFETDLFDRMLISGVKEGWN